MIKAIAEGDPQSIAELAALAEMSEPQAIAFTGLHADAIKGERTRAQQSGKAHIAAAHRIVGKAFERITEQMKSADGFEAAELVKPALRVLEAHEKARLAERESKQNLPVFHITINKGPGASIQVRAMDPEAMEVIEDVTPKVLGGAL